MRNRLIAGAVAVVLLLAGCGNEHKPNAAGIKRPKCNKVCQGRNDVYLTNYTDYFINDSDGKKDSVFTVYHGVPFGDFKCDVVKTFESRGVSMSVVCPNMVSNGVGSRNTSDDDQAS